jgi:integrase
VNLGFEGLLAANINLDLLGLGFRLFGEFDLQHTLVIVGAHLPLIHGTGQCERAGEASVLPLNAAVVLFLLFLLDVALAMDGESAVVDVDMNVLFVDARDFKLQNDVVLVFVGAAVRSWWLLTPLPGLRDHTTHGKDGSCDSCDLAWWTTGRNPITLVRQSAQRKWTPEILEPAEIQNLLLQLSSCFRLMVLLGVTTGLRRSELLALKWSDVELSTLELNVVRSIYLRMVGNCKTEASRKPVPLDVHVAADLWLWKEASSYSKPDDWIFASPHTQGRFPYWPDALLLKIIQPAALRAGIKKRIGWHTFRHSYSSLLVANGENVKVVQELMRHASSRFTLDVYSQARKGAKRQAQQRVVQMILPENFDDAVPEISLGGARNDVE